MCSACDLDTLGWPAHLDRPQRHELRRDDEGLRLSSNRPQAPSPLLGFPILSGTVKLDCG